MLDSTANRTAAWYYLKGLILCAGAVITRLIRIYRGLYQMDPSNYEYRSALNRMHTAHNAWDESFQYELHQPNVDVCTMCQFCGAPTAAAMRAAT